MEPSRQWNLLNMLEIMAEHGETAVASVADKKVPAVINDHAGRLTELTRATAWS